jgi:hypothetical protein
MHITKNYIIISALSFIAAIFFFALYNQWLIITIAQNKNKEIIQTSILRKKEIILYYFNHEKWNNEKQEILWSDNATKNIYQLLNAWLTLLDEERIISKKITLQTALLSSSGTMYLSFDHNPLAKEDIIFKKWILIEGLLKTITVNNIPIQYVQFLVQHQLLHDQHIDFSMPWPVQGFII